MENVIILRRIFTIFGISLLITAILIYLYKGSFEKFSDNSKMLMHTVSVQEKTEELLGLIKDTESGTRGYVISDDEAFLEPFIIANLKLKARTEDLRNLLKDNPAQLKTLDTLSNLIDRKLEFQRFIIHLKKTDNFKFGNKELMWNSKNVMDSIRVLISRMKSAQNTARIIRDLEVREATNNYRVLSTIFSITVLVIMICSLAYILWEIRSKKKVKNLLNAVLESSQSGIMSFNAVRSPEERIVDFIFVQLNRNGAEMLGFENTNMIGRSIFDIIPGNEVDELFDAYSEVIEKNTIYSAEKFYIRNKIKIWYRIIAVKLDDGVTVTFDDISKEKGYEEELKNYIIELKRSNNELEQFAFVASHDLQEPLRKILTFGDRLKMTTLENLNENSKVYIDKMLAAAGRMSKLINDLLSFSRLTRLKDSFERTDLNKIFADVLNDLELSIQNKKAIICADEFPVVVGVPSQLYQLFFNLIGNALKFSRNDIIPEISLKVENLNVRKERVSSGKSGSVECYVRITISDNGIGFENQYAERIFEIFQRLNGRTEFEGTGIGLAICKRIVTNHHGNIYAKGEPNAGSVFVIELPLTQPEN